MAANIGNAYVTVMPTTKGFIKTLSGAGAKGGASSGKGFTDSFGSSIRGGAIVGAASAAFSKVAGVVSSSMEAAISRVDTLNNFPKVMQSIGYSADESQAQIEKLSSRLSNLPTRLDAMVSSVQQLAPSSKSLEQATDRALAFNDALLAGGGSAQVQENALAQLTKACSTGKMEMDSWMSIQEAMPGQLDQVAKSMLGADKSASDLYQAMKDGKVSVSDFADEIVRLDQEGGDGFDSFSRQAENATGGIKTSIANMQNAVTKGVANVIQALSPEAITGPVNLIKGGINAAFGAVVGSIEALKDAFSRIAPSIDTQWVELVGTRFQRVADAGAGLCGALLAVGDEFISSGAAAEVVNGALWALNSVVGAVETPLRLAAEYLGAFVQECAENGAVEAFSAVMGDLSLIVGSVAGFVMEASQALFDWAGGADGAKGAADGFKGVLDGLHSVLEPVSFLISELSENFDAVGPAVMGAAAGLAAFKAATAISSAVESAKAAITAFKTANEGATVAQAAMNAVMSANPFVLAATAIAAVVAALAYFLTQTELGREIWGGFCDFVSSAVEGLAQFFSDAVGAICGFFTETVPDAVQGFIDFMGSLPETVAGFLASVLDGIAEWAVGLGEKALEAGTTFFNNLVQFFVDLPMNIVTLLGTVIGLIAGFAVTIGQQALEAGTAFFSNVARFFMELPGNIWSWLCNAIDFLGQWATQTVTDGIRAGQQFLAGVADFFRQLPGKLLGFLSSAASNVAGWVSRTVNDGIRAGSQFLSNVASFFRQLPGKIWEFLASAISKLGSFVSDCISKAGEAGKGFLDGIKGGFDSAVEFVKGIPQRCLDALGNIGGFLLDAGKSLIGGFTDGIMNGFKAAGDAVQNGIQNIRDFFPFSPAKKGPLSGRGYTTFSGRHMMADWAASIAAAAPEAVRSAMEAASEVSSALAVDAAPVSVAARPVGGDVATGDAGAGRPVVNQVLNFNEPWRSPDQVARAVRLEARYGLAASY